MSLVALLDRVFDTLLGGRDDDRSDRRGDSGRGTFALVPPDQVFIDTISLPVSTQQQAQEAVALQIDRLCPYDPAETVWDVAPSSAPSESGSRRKFTLVAAPVQVLERLRAERSARPVEAFVVPLDEPAVRAVLYDERAISARRSRRTRLVLAAAALVAALAFFSDTVGTTSADREASASSKAQATATAVATAQQRTAQAQALMTTASTWDQEDSLSAATHILAALSAPAIPGMQIESIVVEQNTARLSGYTDDVGGLEAALRARATLRVISFSLSPEPDRMGRGRRFEAQMSTGGADEPS